MKILNINMTIDASSIMMSWDTILIERMNELVFFSNENQASDREL